MSTDDVMRSHRLTETDLRRLRLAGRTVGAVTGAVAGVTALSAVLLMRQAAEARRIIPMAEAPPPRGDGVYGAKFGGKPLKFVMMGDSTAAGYGVHRPRETPGALFATGISRRMRRPVRLHRLAVVGSVSAGLPYQVDVALEYEPDLAVIFIGGNDVTHVSARPSAIRHLSDTVRRLRAAGCRVVVGTCPDLGAIKPIKPPLRWLARRWSRELATAQTIAVVEAGGRTVSLGNLLGPLFEAEPARMYSADRFHPSAEGYARAVSVMMPTVLAVLGTDDRVTVPVAEDLRDLAEAADEAVRAPGTEVAPSGRWARMRKYRWFSSRSTAHIPGGDPQTGAVGYTPEDHQVG